MLTTIILALLASSATVIAAPYSTGGKTEGGVVKEVDIVKDIHKTYKQPEYYTEDSSSKENDGFSSEAFNNKQGYNRQGYKREGYNNNNREDSYYDVENGGGYEALEGYGSYKGRESAGGYEGTEGYESEGYQSYQGRELGHEDVHAKQILCPAVYKVVYITVPVKCQCKTETQYEDQPYEFDIKNVRFDSDISGYEDYEGGAGGSRKTGVRVGKEYGYEAYEDGNRSGGYEGNQRY